MSAEVIPKREMPAEFQVFGQADIEVMREFVWRGLEGLAAGNAQVAPVPVTHQLQFANDERKIGVGSQENVEVDDWLGGEAGNSGAAYVFDYGREWTEREGDA